MLVVMSTPIVCVILLLPSRKVVTLYFMKRIIAIFLYRPIALDWLYYYFYGFALVVHQLQIFCRNIFRYIYFLPDPPFFFFRTQVLKTCRNSFLNPKKSLWNDG